MRKKIGSILFLTFFLAVALQSFAFAATISDIKGHWAGQQINNWVDKGLAGGYSDGTFKPNKEVTRAEFVALVNRAFGFNQAGTASQFKDVNEGQWFYGDVSAAKAAGYIGGYSDGSFKPNQTITRQEVASILVRLMKLEATFEESQKFADSGQIQQWARESVGAVVKNNLMSGYPDNTFRPAKGITRAEAVVTLDRAMPGQVTSGIEGAVTFNGTPVSDATVRVFSLGSYKELNEVKTDSNGFFKLDLAAGSYDVSVATSNLAGFKSGVKLEKNKISKVEVDLVKAAVINGTLESKNGKVIKNGKLIFTTNPTFIANTDKDGKFTVALLPERNYTVRAYNPDKQGQEPEMVKDGLVVGVAGTHSIGKLEAPFEIAATTGGGGGGGGTSGTSVTIKQIEDIYMRVILGGKFTLPAKVTATMSNDTTQEFAVTWVPNVVETNVSGVYTFSGTVSGYDKKVKLTLAVETPLGKPVVVEEGKPVVIEGGITIAGLPAGAQITVIKADEVQEQPGVIDFAGTPMKFTFAGKDLPKEGIKLRLLTNSDDAALCYYNEKDNKWEMIPGSKIVIEGNQKFVEATVTHFSIYGPIKKSAKLIADSITKIDNPKSGDTKLVLPEIPEGFTLRIKSSSNEGVIDRDGNINPPAVDTTVKLVLEVSKGAAKADTIEFSVVVPAYNVSVPTILSITKATGAKIEGKNIFIPIKGLTKESGITVSKDSKLDFVWEGFGSFGSLDLKANKENNIYNIAFPSLAHSDIEPIQFGKLFDALKKCDPATQDAIIAAINFTALFEAIRDTGEATHDAVIEKIHFTNLFDAIVSSTYKDAVFSNMSNVLDLMRQDSSGSKIKIIGAINPALSLANDKGIISDDEWRAILEGNTNVISFSNLFERIKASGADTQKEIIEQVNFKQLFEGIKGLTPSTKDAIFDAVDFTTLFKAVQEADKSTKEVIFNDIVEVVKVLRDSSLTRSQVIDSINWSGLDRDCLFNWLKQVGANPEAIVVTLTLKDAVLANVTNQYTLKITN